MSGVLFGVLITLTIEALVIIVAMVWRDDELYDGRETYDRH